MPAPSQRGKGTRGTNAPLSISSLERFTSLFSLASHFPFATTHYFSFSELHRTNSQSKQSCLEGEQATAEAEAEVDAVTAEGVEEEAEAEEVVVVGVAVEISTSTPCRRMVRLRLQSASKKLRMVLHLAMIFQIMALVTQ